MINENILTELTEQMNLIPFGARLKAARESMKLDIKDAAARLRLNERIISMMENDDYPSDLPPTFIRGYIRSYGKLLQIPEEEIAEAIEPIKPTDTVPPHTPVSMQQMPLTSSNYMVQGITYIVILTVLGLVGLWWHSHNNSNTKKNVPITLPEPSSQSVTDEELTNMNNPVAPGQPGAVAPTPTLAPNAMINNLNAAVPDMAPTANAPQSGAALVPATTENTTPSSEPKYLQHPQPTDTTPVAAADDAVAADDGTGPDNMYTRE